jgi:aryl-alcohol dehydrogenase-like predicted oxidoreductase
MKMKPLGRTGVQVSQLCFGTMAFGGDADAAEAARMYRAGRDAGINFFDTADQYAATATTWSSPRNASTLPAAMSMPVARTGGTCVARSRRA